MIHVRDLTVSYGDQAVLQKVSFDVQPGECLVVTGPSGCGKSTLARVLTGLIPQVIPAEISGTVQVAGLDVRAHTPAEISASVGTVFQDPSTHLFHLRVADEVAFGPQNLNLAPDEIRARVEWAMDTLGLTGLADRKPSDLSGGQKQRLAIASALAMRPSVLVLDEPTASLDVPGTRSVVAALEELRQKFGLTIILMEHRLAEVRNLADRVLVLDKGRAVASGEFDRVLGDHQLLQRYGLRRPTEEPLTRWEDLLSPNGNHPEGAQPLLEVQDVSAGYRGQAVVENVNLELYPGEFIALVGDNGAGKSTLALAIAGLLKPLHGQVRFLGRPRLRPGLDISLLFQNPADQLFTDSVEEELAFGPRNLRCYEPAWAEQVLANADLTCLRTRRPLSLSVGQQQRTALASCLSLRPRLVILDEPTLGQDWGHLQQLMDFILALNQQGTAILLITHDYKLVYRYAQRVILMDAGRISLDGHNNLAAQKNRSSDTQAQVKHEPS
jgi:energy-coupling factor transporter ATP-binding protein EcfA2